VALTKHLFKAEKLVMNDDVWRMKV